MKSRYFKFVAIDKPVIDRFVSNHPQISKYVDTNQPFYVRISKKAYPGLIHTIISQDLSSEQIKVQWNQLIDFAKKIKPKKIAKLSLDTLTKIVGQEKANLISQLTTNIINETLDLDLLSKQSEDLIIENLSKYQGLSLNSIKTFAIFGLSKQNILADQDQDFIKGLQIFLNKQNIEQQDINSIKIEYRGELTLFSLCMWKIRNERLGK